jgi:hypothetical protein
VIELRPTAQQERWLAAAALFKVRNHPWIAQRSGGWHAPSFIARCAFFVLGAVAGALTAAVFEILSRGAALIAAGVTLLIAAEWLILRKRLFHAGVEEALWTGGLLLLAAHFVPSGDRGVSVAIALVLAAAAMRLLNPLLLTLAFVAASIAVELIGGHRLWGEHDVAMAASVFCYGVGASALLLARVQFSRPSHDHMLSWLMIIMPLCGFLWLATQHDAAIRVGTGLASGCFALAALTVGIRRRSHAPLLACMVSLGCVAYQLRDLTALSLKFKLIVWGSAALLAAVGLDRYLRTARRGITSLQLSEGTAALDLMQWVGAGALSPKAEPPADAPFKGGGGGFSGGGADGRY